MVKYVLNQCKYLTVLINNITSNEMRTLFGKTIKMKTSEDLILR